jgi:hypothetical protein
MDLTLTALTTIVIGIAAFVHGIAGFGFAQVSMGLLPLFRETAVASIIFMIPNIASNGRVFWSVRDSFVWHDWLMPVGGLVLGMPLGIYVFKSLNDDQLRLAVGIVLVMAVVLVALMRQTDYVDTRIRSMEVRPGRKAGISAGFFAGILGGAVAIPGPPMIVYGAFMVAGDYWKGARMKAVLTAFFGTLMTYRLCVLAYAGSITTGILAEALVVLPVQFLCAWMGIRIFRSIPERLFGWIVLAGLAVNAAILIVSSIV